MRSTIRAAAAALLTALCALTAAAQQSTIFGDGSNGLTGVGAGSHTTYITAVEVAVINPAEFTNPQAGVARLVGAIKSVEREAAELRGLKTRYDELVTVLSRSRRQLDERRLSELADQAEALQAEITPKERALEGKLQRLTEPIYKDLEAALREYARARGIRVVLDITRMGGAVMVVDSTADITADFIADYNRRNPAAP